jgi:hypothetical protein
MAFHRRSRGRSTAARSLAAPVPSRRLNRANRRERGPQRKCLEAPRTDPMTPARACPGSPRPNPRRVVELANQLGTCTSPRACRSAPSCREMTTAGPGQRAVGTPAWPAGRQAEPGASCATGGDSDTVFTRARSGWSTSHFRGWRERSPRSALRACSLYGDCHLDRDSD